MEKELDFNQANNPVKTAEEFALLANAEGFTFDFSLKSLENEIDRYLEKYSGANDRRKAEMEALLTAYIGETIRKRYQGQWEGEYYRFKPGANYYTCHVKIGEFDFWPSHFIGYYFSNGKEAEGTFYEYLYNLIQKKQIGKTF